MSRESASRATDPASNPDTSSTPNIAAFTSKTRRSVDVCRPRSPSIAQVLSLQQSSIVHTLTTNNIDRRSPIQSGTTISQMIAFLQKAVQSDSVGVGVCHRIVLAPSRCDSCRQAIGNQLHTTATRGRSANYQITNACRRCRTQDVPRTAV